MQIGAQLYTLRNHCRTLDDFALTLKKVADIGYRIVQVSGTCDFDAAWLKTELNRNGLKCVLTHNPEDKLLNATAQMVDEHSAFSCDHIGLGGYVSFREGMEESLAEFKAKYAPVAKELMAAGKVFMYHNHSYEFRKINGRLILDQIAEAIPEMGFTLDTYWVQVGGGDPAQWLEKLSGRVPCIHLKDCAYQQRMAVVGEGNINFDRVFQTAEAAGTKYMLVEQDDCYGEDPFDCLKRSYMYLKANGFE